MCVIPTTFQKVASMFSHLRALFNAKLELENEALVRDDYTIELAFTEYKLCAEHCVNHCTGEI